jgi:hypothetical protein
MNVLPTYGAVRCPYMITEGQGWGDSPIPKGFTIGDRANDLPYRLEFLLVK